MHVHEVSVRYAAVCRLRDWHLRNAALSQSVSVASLSVCKGRHCRRDWLVSPLRVMRGRLGGARVLVGLLVAGQRCRIAEGPVELGRRYDAVPPSCRHIAERCGSVEAADAGVRLALLVGGSLLVAEILGRGKPRWKQRNGLQSPQEKVAIESSSVLASRLG